MGPSVVSETRLMSESDFLALCRDISPTAAGARTELCAPAFTAAAAALEPCQLKPLASPADASITGPAFGSLHFALLQAAAALDNGNGTVRILHKLLLADKIKENAGPLPPLEAARSLLKRPIWVWTNDLTSGNSADSAATAAAATLAAFAGTAPPRMQPPLPQQPSTRVFQHDGAVEYPQQVAPVRIALYHGCFLRRFRWTTPASRFTSISSHQQPGRSTRSCRTSRRKCAACWKPLKRNSVSTVRLTWATQTIRPAS